MLTPLHRVLIVGVGSIGERHVRCLRNTGRAEVGLCETNAALLHRVGETYGIDERFASLDDALQRGWDTAVVATPAPSHIPLSLRLVEHGIAPLIEKPLAVVAEGAAEFIEAVRQHGMTAGVAYVYRAHPALRAMRGAIGSGRFGRVLQVTAAGGQHFPTYRPGYRDTYYARHEAGGGAVQDALTHVVNAVEWVAGPTTAVVADVAHMALEGVEVEDTVHVLARNGEVMVNYSLNQHQAPNELSVTVVCERGTARFDLQNHRWSWMETPETPWTHEATSFATRDDWFTAQESAWLDALEGKQAVLCTLGEGLQTLRVNQAILASARSGERIELTQEDAAWV